MSSHATRRVEYNFTNPNALAATFDVRTSGGAVAQNEDHVRLTDDGALGFDPTAVSGIVAADLKCVEILARAASAPPQSVTAFIGIADKAGADQDYTNLANFVGFVMPGTAAGGALSVQAKTTGLDSGLIATNGFTLQTSWQRFKLNLWENTVSVSPPSASKSGLANVKLSAGNDDGYVRIVDVSAAMDISDYTAQLQPLVLLTGGTLNLDVKEIVLEYAIR